VCKEVPVELNLADPDAIRRKLPELYEWVERKRRAVEQAQRELETTETLVEQLRALAGSASLPTSGKLDSGQKEASAQDAVVRVINEAKRPLRAVDVAGKLDNPIKRDTVNWALWHAEKEGLIKRVSQGLYASLDYQSPPEDHPSPEIGLPSGDVNPPSAREARRQRGRGG
jgi:hypothetical protein